MKSLFVFLFLLGVIYDVCSQTSQGIGTTTPNPKAVLDIASVTQGLLAPRMTTAQRTSIAATSTEAGLMVFDKTVGAYFIYDGTVWQQLQQSSTGTPWIVSGSSIYPGNLSDFVGIGTSSPSGNLHVFSSSTGSVSQYINYTTPCSICPNQANFWQSFTANFTGLMTSISFGFGAGTGITYSIYSGVGTGGTLLYSNTANGAGINCTITSSLPVSGVNLINGQQYTIGISGASGGICGIGSNQPGTSSSTSNFTYFFTVSGQPVTQSSTLLVANSLVGIGNTSPVSLFSVGSASQFQVNTSGNIVKINNVTTSFPAAQGTSGSFLQNDGAGNLSWSGSGLLSGGTLNYVSKWSSANSLTSSLVYDNGTNVGIGTSSPNSSAQLDITSTTTGFLPPRMTIAQRNAIVSPAAGLMIFNTNTNGIEFYNGNAWVSAFSSKPFAAIYEDNFINGVTPTAAQVTYFNNFRASLVPSNYSSVSLSGSNSPSSIVSCNVAATVASIATALKNGTTASYVCGSNTWYIGTCTGVEISVNQSICNCGSAYSLRPGIPNSNWGGITGSTCSAPSQSIMLVFE